MAFHARLEAKNARRADLVITISRYIVAPFAHRLLNASKGSSFLLRIPPRRFRMWLAGHPPSGKSLFARLAEAFRRGPPREFCSRLSAWLSPLCARVVST